MAMIKDCSEVSRLAAELLFDIEVLEDVGCVDSAPMRSTLETYQYYYQGIEKAPAEIKAITFLEWKNWCCIGTYPPDSHASTSVRTNN